MDVHSSQCNGELLNFNSNTGNVIRVEDIGIAFEILKGPCFRWTHHECICTLDVDSLYLTMSAHTHIELVFSSTVDFDYDPNPKSFLLGLGVGIAFLVQFDCRFLAWCVRV